MGMVTIRIRKLCTFSEYLEIMYASGYPQTRQISVVRIPRRKDFRITLKYVASRNFANHFSLDHFGDAGLTVIPEEISTSSASIRITAHAKNLPKDAMISYTVLTTTGTMLANKSVPPRHQSTICHLTNPCLWNENLSKAYVVWQD